MTTLDIQSDQGLQVDVQGRDVSLLLHQRPVRKCMPLILRLLEEVTSRHLMQGGHDTVGLFIWHFVTKEM